MHNAKILSSSALIMVVASLLASRAIPRYEQPQSTPLPIEGFPRKVGDWTGGPDRPTPPAVQEMLSKATIVDRIYTRPGGDAVNLTLITSSRVEDFHDPRSCFPGQGWDLRGVHVEQVEGEQVTAMTAVQGEETLDVLYWQTARAPEPVGGLIARARRLRNSLGGSQGQSLFVRVTAPRGAHPFQTVRAFVHAITPPLRTLKALAHTNQERARQ